MLTFREKQVIKSILKRYELYSKHQMNIITSVYETLKHKNIDELFRTMKERKSSLFHMDVWTALAYKELRESSDNFATYEKEYLMKKTVVTNGNEVEYRVVDFNECPFNVNCSILVDIINVYDEIKNGYDTNGDLVNAILIILFNVLSLKYKEMKMDGMWSIKERVEKIKAAEDKYDVKFFVNDYLYDTFMHPELFESYGIYKNNNVFRMSKDNIVQDSL